MSQPGLQGKSHDIPKQLIWAAWLKVKENGGAAGADGVTIEQFETRLADNLYRLWNRISSGSYFPGPVRAVEIPKKGGIRILCIPNVVPGGAERGGAGVGAERGEGVPQRLLRVPSRAVTGRCGAGVPAAVFSEGLGRRFGREGLLGCMVTLLLLMVVMIKIGCFRGVGAGYAGLFCVRCGHGRL